MFIFQEVKNHKHTVRAAVWMLEVSSPKSNREYLGKLESGSSLSDLSKLELFYYEQWVGKKKESLNRQSC